MRFCISGEVEAKDINDALLWLAERGPAFERGYWALSAPQGHITIRPDGTKDKALESWLERYATSKAQR